MLIARSVVAAALLLLPLSAALACDDFAEEQAMAEAVAAAKASRLAEAQQPAAIAAEAPAAPEAKEVRPALAAELTATAALVPSRR
jgi:hypothetical protein